MNGNEHERWQQTNVSFLYISLQLFYIFIKYQASTLSSITKRQALVGRKEKKGQKTK